MSDYIFPHIILNNIINLVKSKRSRGQKNELETGTQKGKLATKLAFTPETLCQTTNTLSS